MRNLISGFLVIAALAIVAVTITPSGAVEPAITMPTSATGQSFPALRPGTTTAIQYTTTNVSPEAVIEAHAVRLMCTTNCLIQIGSDPTATISTVLMQASEPEIFRVISGVDTVGVIQANDEAGVIYITPMK